MFDCVSEWDFCEIFVYRPATLLSVQWGRDSKSVWLLFLFRLPFPAKNVWPGNLLEVGGSGTMLCNPGSVPYPSAAHQIKIWQLIAHLMLLVRRCNFFTFLLVGLLQPWMEMAGDRSPPPPPKKGTMWIQVGHRQNVSFLSEMVSELQNFEEWAFRSTLLHFRYWKGDMKVDTRYEITLVIQKITFELSISCAKRICT